MEPQRERKPETRVERVVVHAPADDDAEVELDAARDTGGPGGGAPPPPAVQRLYVVDLITEAQKKADESARRARADRTRTFACLGAVLALAVAAVGVGIAVDSPAFWGAAGSIFVACFSVPIAYLARELGVFAESAELVTRLLGRAGPGEPAVPPAEPGSAASEEHAAMERQEAAADELYRLGWELHGRSVDGKGVYSDDHLSAYVLAALEAFDRAAELGHGIALASAGEMYRQLDTATAAEVNYVKACHPLGAYWLGRLHAAGSPPAQPEEWWLALAKQGNIVAAYVLGAFHEARAVPSGEFDPVKELEEPIRI